MMINKRLWFRKTGRLKYISHLDFSRYMGRLLKRTGLPLWYTEGFNPHLYMVFSQPLPLGMTGICESLDVRLTEPMENSSVLEKLQTDPNGDLAFYDVTDPVMKPGEIAYASYRARYSAEGESGMLLAEKFGAFAAQESIMIEKKSKSGSRPFDLAPYVREISFEPEQDSLILEMILPAGSGENVNPRLIGEAFEAYAGLEIFQEIRRNGMFSADMKKFL